MHARKGEPALRRDFLGRSFEKDAFVHMRRTYLSGPDPTVRRTRIRETPAASRLRGRFFEAAARHRSFVCAAEELGVTPPAVGHRIRILEAHLGAELFERRRRGVYLNRRGRVYYEEDWPVWFVDRVECLSQRREGCRPMPAIASGFCRRPRQRVVGPRHCRPRRSPDWRRPQAARVGRPRNCAGNARTNLAAPLSAAPPRTSAGAMPGRPGYPVSTSAARLSEMRIAPSRTQFRSRCA